MRVVEGEIEMVPDRVELPDPDDVASDEPNVETEPTNGDDGSEDSGQAG